MRIPEPLFMVINAVMKTLLRSPLHGLMSKDILLIIYTGRKSGLKRETPVRYINVDGVIRCFTTTDTQWWRNLSDNSDVELLLAGHKGQFKAVVLRGPDAVQQKLVHFLALYPQDAAYQNIRLNKDKSLNGDDLSAALHSAVLVEFVDTDADGIAER